MSKKMRKVRRGAILSMAIAAVPLASLQMNPPARATIYYWDTNGSTSGFGSVTGTWDGTNTFWDQDLNGTAGPFIAAPTIADDLNISAGTAGTLTISGTGIASSLTLSDNVANTITGGTLQLGGTGNSDGLFVTSNVTAATAISSALSLNTDDFIQNAGTGVLTLSGGITGAHNLTLQNNGATTAGITISTGSLNNGGTITNSGTGGSVTINSLIGSNVTGIIQNSPTSALNILGGATASNTFTGGITIKAGTVNVTSTSPFTGFGSGPITLGDTASNAAAVTLSANGSQASYPNAIVVNSGTSGVITFTTTNGTTVATYTGGISGSNATGLTFNTGVTTTGGFTFSTNGITFAGPLKTTGAGTGVITFNSVISAITSFSQGSSGTTTFAGTANTFDAPISISAGTLSFATIANVGSGASSLGNPSTVANGTINLSGGSLSYSGAGSVSTDRVLNFTAAANVYATSSSGTLNLTGGITGTTSAITFRGAGTINESGVIPAGVTTVQHTDPGTLVLSNPASLFTGNLVALTGTISVNSVSDAGVASAIGRGSTIQLGQNNTSPSGTLIYTGPTGSTNRAWALLGGTAAAIEIIQNDSSGTLTLGGNATYTPSSTATTFALQGSGAGIFNGNLNSTTTGTPALGFTKAGAGTWTINSATLNYQGATNINAGTLVLNASPTGTTGYTISGTAGNNATLSGTGTLAAAVTMSAGTAFTGAAINPGTVGGAGTLTINALLTTGNFSRLNFDLNTAQTAGLGINDLLITNTLPVITSTTQVNLNALGTLTPGAYTLISGYTGTIANAAGLTPGTLTGDVTHSILGFQNNAGSLQVVIGNAPSSAEYWAGNINGAWNALAGGTNWRTDATSNTDSVAFPGANTDVHFVTTNPVASNFTTTLGQNFTINTLNIDPSASALVSIAGNTLTITPASATTGINLANGSAGLTISSALTVGAAQTWTNNSGVALTVGAVSNGANTVTLDGSGNFAQTGVWGSGAGGITTASTFAGTLTLNQANTFTGAVLINGGTVAAGGNAAALGTGAATLTLAGGSLVIGDDTARSFGRNTTIASNTSITTTRATAGAGVTHTLGTLAIGAQTLTVNGAVATSGNQGLTFGAVTLSGAPTFTINNDGLGATTLLTLGAITGANTDLTFNGTGNVTVSGIVGTGTGAINMNGTGTLTLSNSGNTYTGAINISSGALSVSALGGLGTATNNINLGTATTKGTLIYTGSAATLGRNFTIAAGGGEIDSTTAALTLTPTTVAPIDLTNGPLTFGGANSINLTESTATQVPFTGTNALNKTGAGTVTITTTTATPLSASAMPINVQAGTFKMTETAGVTTNILGNGGLITLTPGATLSENFGTFANTANNSINIVGNTGTAIITLSGGLATSGPVTFLSGSGTPTLQLTNINNTTNTQSYSGGFSGTGNLVLNATGSNAPITLASSAGSTVNIIGAITATGTGGSTSTQTISAPVGSGVTSITQAGSNTPFTVSGLITANPALTIASSNTGLLTLSGGITGTSNLTLNNTGNGTITISGAAINTTGSLTFSGGATNEGINNITANIGANVTNLPVSGANTQTILSGTNTYTGTATINSGILDFQKTASLPGFVSGNTAIANIAPAITGTLAVGYGGTGTFSSADIDNFLNGTYVTFSGANAGFGLDTTGASASYTSIISNPPGTSSFGLTKLGANTLTLGTANTYNGPTFVQQGTLTVASINSVSGGASSSSLGAPTTIANGTIHLGYNTNVGTLSYTGPGETTDRVIDLSGTSGGGTIDNSGNGTLTFSSDVSFSQAATGQAAKTLAFAATTADINFNGKIQGGFAGSTAPVTLAKSGSGTLTLSDTGTYSFQNITLSGGILNTGANGISLNNTTGTTIAATGNATINGKIILMGSITAGNGGDVGANGNILTINANIVEGVTAAALDFNPGTAAGMVILTGANSWTGQTNINSAETVQVSSLNTVNSVTAHSVTSTHQATSNLGAPTTAANGTILFSSGGVLKYVGIGENTDRAVALNSGNGAIDSSGTGLLYFSGGVTQAGTPGVRTLTLQGTSTGEIAGGIADNSATNTTGIIKAGTGTWTLSGTNTYTGATTINGGNLILKNGGALNNTAITINSGATLSISGGAFTAGAATSGKGASLTLNAGGVLNLADGTIGTLTLTNAYTANTTEANFAGGSITFDIGATGDQISLTGSAFGQAASSGGNAIVINGLSGIAAGNYTLINAPNGGLTSSAFYLASNTISVGATKYNLSLSSSSGTAEVLTVSAFSGAGIPAAAYWNGTTTSSWAYQPGGAGTATNWLASGIGSPDTLALPGIGTNVTFTSNVANPANLSTTLDQNFEINSLTFSGTGTNNTAGSTIASGGAGANTLRIDAAALNGNAAGNGITVASGSGANTISANVVLGASQTWTTAAGTSLTLSGAIGDGGSNYNLTTAGAGTLVLSGTSTYGGSTTVTTGTLAVQTLANGGSPSSIGQSSNAASNLVLSGATLQYIGSGSITDRNYTFGNATTATGAAFDSEGTGPIVINGAMTSANIAASTQTLTLNANTASGANTLGGAIVNGTGSAVTAVSKTGLGTWSLGGTNTYTGNTTVSAGSLNITGSLTGNGTTSSGSALIFGASAGNQIVNVSGSISGYFYVAGASVNGAAAIYNQTAGTVSTTNTGTSDTTNDLTSVAGGYGYFNLTGGTFNALTGRFDVNGKGGTGVMYVGNTAGGTPTLNAKGEWFIIGPYSTATGVGEVTVGPNGTIDHSGANSYVGLNMNINNSYGILNVAGGSFLTTTKSLTFGNSTNTATNTVGIFNLDAGTFGFGTAFLNANTGAGSSGKAFLNFAGGTLLNNTANVTAIIPASNTTQTFTSTLFGPIDNSAATGDTSQNFAGGLTVNTASFNSSFTNVFNGATGYGVTQGSLNVTGGAGYVGAPSVQFSIPAAGGAPASGYALISSGQVTGIVITAPGTYASGEVPTITLTGGGFTTAATVTSNPLTTLNANTGGLTKIGGGTLILSSAASTYAGVTTISGGTLQVSGAGTLANIGSPSGIGTGVATSNVTNAASLVLDGGTFSMTSVNTATTDRLFTLTQNGGGLDQSNTTNTNTVAFVNTGPIAFSGSGARTLTLGGPNTASAGFNVFAPLVGNAGSDQVSVAKIGAGEWELTNNNTYTGPTIINQGTLTVPALGTAGAGGTPSPLGASSNAPANLVLGGGTLQYVGAGDTTDRNYTFGNATTPVGGGLDSEGAGPLVVAGNMTPVNASGTLNTQVLTLTANAASGANLLNGAISDSPTANNLTGLTKAGAGAWTLAAANAYSGATTVSGGTLNITGTNSGSSAYSVTGSGAVLNINSSGTVAASTLSFSSGATVALLGGTLSLSGNVSAVAGTTDLTFNGGTLKSAAPITIGSNLPINVLAGGGTIDTTGGNITSTSTVGNTASPGTLNIVGGNTLQSAFGATFTGNASISGTGTTVKFVTTAAAYSGLWTISTGSILDINNVGNYSFGGLAGGGTLLNTGASAVRTITITGTGGNTFAGSIAPATNQLDTALTVNLTSGTQTFTGAHTYTGATTLSAGILALSGTNASLSDTAVSVSSGATLAVLPGANGGAISVGTSGSGNAKLTLNAGSNFSMADGTIGTFNVNTATTGTVFTLAGALLAMDLNSSGLDKIVISGGSTNSITGNSQVSLNILSSSLTPGSYTLISAQGIAAGNSNFTFAGLGSTTSVMLNGRSYPLTLSSTTAGVEALTIGAPQTSLTWTGQTNGTGTANSAWANGAGNNNFADSNFSVADYIDGAAVTFQDLNAVASVTTPNTNVTNANVVTDGGGVKPGSVTVSNSAVNYTFSNTSGTIGIADGPAGPTSLTKTGAGKLTLSGNNTFTGPVTLDGGTLSLNVAEDTNLTPAFGPLGIGGSIFFTGGTLQYTASNTYDYSSRFSTAANQAVSIDTNGQNVTFATALNSSGGTLTKTGAGVLTLGATTSTFTGNIVVSGGLLAFVGSNGAAGDPLALGSGAKTITLTSGGGVRVMTSLSNPTSTVTKSFVVGTAPGDSGVFDVQGVTFQFDDAGEFSGPGNLTVQGNNTTTAIVYLNNQTFNFTGNVNISGGATAAVLRLGAGSVLGTATGRSITVASGGELDVNSATLTLPASTTINLNGDGTNSQGALSAISASGTIPGTASVVLQSDSSLAAGSTFTLTENGAISGAFALGKRQPGTVVLGAANTYTGATNIFNGTLQASSINSVVGGLPSSSLGAPTTVATGTINFGNGTNSGILKYTGPGETTDRVINLAATTGGATVDQSGAGLLKFTSNLTASGVGAKTLTLQGSSAGAGELDGNIVNSSSGATSLTKFGSGTWTVAGTNTYTGTTTVQQGTLLVANSQALGLSNPLVMGDTSNNAGQLNLQTFNATVSSLTVNTIGTTLNANSITIGSGNTLNINGNVTIGPVATAANQKTSLLMTGGGTLLVNTATAGTIQVGGNSGTNNFAENATWDMTALGGVTLNASTTGAINIYNNQATNIAGNQASMLMPAPTTGITQTTPVTTITAATLTIGGGSGNNAGAGQTNALTFGSGLTTLNINTINVGTGGRDFGQITVAPGNASISKIVLRAANGTGAAAMNIGTGTGINTGVAAGTGVTNNVDFTGYSADLSLSTLTIGTENRAAAYSNSFSFDTGTLTVGSLVAATRTAESANGAGLARTTTVTVNLGGGTVNINNGITQFGDLAGTYTTAGNSASEIATLTVSGGTVSIGATSGTAITMAHLASSTSTQATTVNATLNFTGGATTLSGNIVRGTTSGSGTTTNTATLTLDGGSLDLGNHNIGASGALLDNINLQSGTLQNVAQINNGAALTKTASAINPTSNTLVLSGNNAFTGTFTVASGLVNLASNTGLGATSAGTAVNAGTTLALSNNITVGAEPLTINGTGYAITGQTGALVNASGTNSFGGPVTLGSASTISSDSGTLNLTNAGAITGGFDLTLAGAGNGSVAGPIGTGGALIKTGAGTWSLAGTNSYTGNTTVQGGTIALVTASNNNVAPSLNLIIGDSAAHNSAVLDVTGVSGAGGFQLSNSQSLSGWGTIKTTSSVPVTLGATGATSAGATIAPGQGGLNPATGKLTITSGDANHPAQTVLADNGASIAGQYTWKLNTDSAYAGASTTDNNNVTIYTDISGANWDSLVMDSVLLTAANQNFTVKLASFSGGSPTQNAFNYASTSGWVIAHANDGTITQTLAQSLRLDTSGFAAGQSNANYMLEAINDPASGTDLVLTYAPTPEPTSLGLLGLAAGGLMLRRRRQRRLDSWR